jgi:hypothetical protein
MDDLTAAIVLLTITLFIHLIEEIKTGFREKLFIGEMPRPVFIGINTLIYIYSFIMIYLSWQGNPAAIPMAWIFALGNILNGSGHIIWMVYKKEYFPGGISAFALLAASGYLIYTLTRI